MFYQAIHSGNIDYFCKEIGKDFSYPLHLHNSFELITIVSGEMEVTVDREKYVLKEKECILIFPNQVHALSSGSCEHVLYIFSSDLVNSYSAKTAGKIPLNSKFIMADQVHTLLSGIDEESSELVKKGVLYLVCEEFNKTAEFKNILNYDPGLIKQVFEFVKDNYMNDCSLKAICTKKGYSYSYLSRFFKKVTGVSFNSYVNQYRIEQSCYLLRTTNLPILECAEEVGYSCLRSFNRNFLLYMDITPNKYREQSKK